MKPDAPRSKLPTLHELLAHPAVASIVKRVNRTTVAQRAAGFWEELRDGLQHRLEQGHLPSVGQLAERLARHLLGPAELNTPCINATGTVLSERFPSVPLAQAATDELIRLTTEYYTSDTALYDQARQAIQELCGAERAWIGPSFALARELALTLAGNIEIARYAGLLDPSDFGHASVPTIETRLQLHDLVVVDGAGLIGGPPCGIVAGQKRLVESIPCQPTSRDAVSEYTLAALLATLKIYRTNDRVTHQIPVWQLLSTPLENLEQRSGRLAALMAECDQVQTAIAAPTNSTWCEAESFKFVSPSWAIILQPHGETTDLLVKKFEEAVPRVIAQDHSGHVQVDLRGVFPRWDQHLVKAVTS